MADPALQSMLRTKRPNKKGLDPCFRRSHLAPKSSCGASDASFSPEPTATADRACPPSPWAPGETS